MESPQQLVQAFHQKYGAKIATYRRLKRGERLEWHVLGMERVRLILEEVTELAEAFRSEDVVEVADAVGDLLYLAYGTAVAVGFDADSVMREIHKSNMSKDAGEFKPVKGPGYFKPDIASELEDQGVL